MWLSLCRNCACHVSSAFRSISLSFSKLHFHISPLSPGFLQRFNQSEGNDNPLQYSCLENPRDRGAWQSAVHEVAKWSRSVVSDPQRTHGLQPSRLLHPWDFPGKSTGVGCHCLLRWATAKSLQSCPTLCDPIDGSLSGSSAHEIFQARVLEWVATGD